MAISFVKSRAKRFEIARLLGEGYTIEDAENIALKGDSNKSRTVKQWRAGGAYPYGDVDKPQDDNFLEAMNVFHNASAAHTQEPLHSGLAAHTEAHIQTAHAAHTNWNDPVLTQKIKALIREVLKEQSTAMHTAHTPIKPSRKLWRTLKNCTPITFRIQTELLNRAKAKLLEDYQGHMSLNHYIELTLWQLVGEPEDLMEPQK